MIVLRRSLSLVVSLASLVAAWALTRPFHYVEVASTGGTERLLHTGITHHSWGVMFVPTAIVLAIVGIAGAWSARPRARVFALATSIAALTWSLVVLGDGFLTDYLMEREAALTGERAFDAARAVIALAGAALAVVASRETVQARTPR